MAPVFDNHISVKQNGCVFKGKIWRIGYTHVLTIPAYKIKEMGVDDGAEMDVVMRKSEG